MTTLNQYGNVQFEAGVISFIATCALSSTKWLGAYQLNGDSKGYVRVFNKANPVTFGGSVEFVDWGASASLASVDICMLSSTKALVVYDKGSSFCAQVVNISGDTITLGGETEIVAAGLAADGLTVCALTSGLAMVAYTYGGSGRARTLSITGDTITANNELALDYTEQYLSIAAITTGAAVLLGSDYAGGFGSMYLTLLTLSVLDVVQSDTKVVDASLTATSDQGRQKRIDYLGGGLVVAAYDDNGTYYAVAATVSGSSFSAVGTPVGIGDAAGLAELDNGRFIVGDEPVSGSVSGTTITGDGNALAVADAMSFCNLQDNIVGAIGYSGYASYFVYSGTAVEFYYGPNEAGIALQCNLDFANVANPSCMAVRDDGTVFVGAADGGAVVVEKLLPADYTTPVDITDSLTDPITALETT